MTRQARPEGQGHDTMGSMKELRARIESTPWDAWTFRRLGLTPAKLRFRLHNGGLPKILCISLPKAGTHLVERALCLHPRLYRKLRPTIAPGMERWDGLDAALGRLRSGQLLVAHLPYDPAYAAVLERRHVRAICTIRDPRDVVLSQVHFIVKRRFHPHHAAFAARSTLAERLELAILGDASTGIPSIRERLERYAGWLGDGSLVVRFEDLVGPKGGGTAEEQRRTVEQIYGHVGIDVTPGFIARVCDELFSPSSPTFRRGATGQWHDAFEPRIVELFAREAGSAAAPYGYEV
jgi:hypothetical protein